MNKKSIQMDYRTGETTPLGEKNENTGIFGTVNENSSLLENVKQRIYKIGGRFSARPGKAKILSCISGTN